MSTLEASTNESDTCIVNQDNVEAPKLDLGRGLVCNWTTGTGPRIGCVRDYPARLQFQALEQVNLSPRTKPEHYSANPVPSPRPSPKFHLSPRLAYMGLPSPRLHNLDSLATTKPHCE